MTETLISPGVSAKETDTSFITRGPVSVGAAIVGPTAKGPVNMPTIVTSYSEFESIFGKSIVSGSNKVNYTFLTSISANNYFQQGGSSLLVTRVADSEFEPASSAVSSSIGVAFEIQTISEGEQMNNKALVGQSEWTSGALVSGSKENIRWEVNYSDPETGNFNLIIRRGDDTTKNKNVLEYWRGLNLDPDSPNYIERVIGNTTYQIKDDGAETYLVPVGEYSNKSSYITIKNTVPTVGYFDNDGNVNPAFTGSLPIVSSGSFSGGKGFGYSNSSSANFFEKIDEINTQGLSVTGSSVPAYDNALRLLSSKEAYQFNVITTPGLTVKDHGSTVEKVIALADSRQDCIAVIDLANFDQNSINEVTELSFGIDSSYAATYWPWLQTIDSGKTVWVPASTMIPGVYSFTDASSEPWFAPAGMIRGGLGRVIQPAKKLTTQNRNDLYTRNINPIAYLPQSGVVVYGQKTLQKKGSALDRINVRRLLIEVKGYISQIADSLIFENNTAATRNNFLSKANPYLESIQERQGLYAFRVIMDESNNDAASIDRNELRGQILLQPAKTIEYILLDFKVTPTGADFS